MMRFYLSNYELTLAYRNASNALINLSSQSISKILLDKDFVWIIAFTRSLADPRSIYISCSQTVASGAGEILTNKASRSEKCKSLVIFGSYSLS